MALDLSSPFKMVSWASAHADCPMRYAITSRDEMVLVFGSGHDEFEFALQKDALRMLVQLGTEALAEMDNYTDKQLGGLVTAGTSTA